MQRPMASQIRRLHLAAFPLRRKPLLTPHIPCHHIITQRWETLGIKTVPITMCLIIRVYFRALLLSSTSCRLRSWLSVRREKGGFRETPCCLGENRERSDPAIRANNHQTKRLQPILPTSNHQAGMRTESTLMTLFTALPETLAGLSPPKAPLSPDIFLHSLGSGATGTRSSLGLLLKV